MLEISLFGALIAGLLSFFTPCVLPMVPFYLSYMGGLSMTELRGDGEIAPGAQRRLLTSAVFFALGVTTVFMLFGMGATALGSLFGQYLEPLSYVAAAILVVFGPLTFSCSSVIHSRGHVIRKKNLKADKVTVSDPAAKFRSILRCRK